MITFPNPTAVLKYSREGSIKAAQAVSGRKVNKAAQLRDLYETARESISLLSLLERI